MSTENSWNRPILFFFQRPRWAFVDFYGLVPDVHPEQDELARVLIKQHVSWELLDRFIADMKLISIMRLRKFGSSLAFSPGTSLYQRVQQGYLYLLYDHRMPHQYLRYTREKLPCSRHLDRL